MTQRRYSSLLELEAADYFKLDLSQVQMFNSPNSSHRSSRLERRKTNTRTSKQAVVYPTSNHGRDAKFGLKQEKQKSTQLPQTNQQRRTNIESEKNSYLVKGSSNNKDGTKLLINSNGPSRIDLHTFGSNKSDAPITVMATSPYLADSSTVSTNSLPSISSSPSVSPSLLCPHLSLDDILALGNESNSPHTIGLCKRCRMDPPPNVHSPLSPAFKPSKKSSQRQMNLSNIDLSRAHIEIKPLKRGYSDQQAAARPVNQDSLDYYVEPSELRRLQLSPIVRNSVEFIRKSTTEAGRVLRIYKNGEPFEKPLRICVSRGEFATLNNLLDFIGSRQLVPSGARYLFHLDGQLVYSVNELKHASIYIVSGTRKYDHKANSILKEQYKRELGSPQAGYRRVSVKQFDDTTLKQPDLAIEEWPQSGSRLPVDLAGAGAQMVPERIKPGQLTREKVPISSAAKQKDHSDAPASRLKQTNREPLGLNAQNQSATSRQKQARAAATVAKKQPSTANLGYHRQQGSSEVASQNQQSLVSTEKKELISESNETILAKPEQRVEEKPISLVRAKSELGSSPNKRRKNVTFVDTLWDSSNAAAASTQSEQDLSQIDRSSAGDVGGSNPPTSGTIDIGLEALRTSEIGIQVSDSMDGFLIDLPIPLPPKGEELRDQKRTYLRKGQGIRAIKTASQSTHKKHPAKTATFKQTPKQSRRVVTISERQLSLDEMYQLKDMDHGDHHSDSRRIQQHVTITLDGVEDLVASDEDERRPVEPSINESDKNIVALKDPNETINIGQVDGKTTQQQQQSSDLDVSQKTDDLKEASETGWQYPGGGQSSTTPTERPISQSEANESVHARVTTPTPSVSTNGGDSSISTPVAGTGVDAGSAGPTNDQRRWRSESAVKKLVPVFGKLCQGVEPPSTNFKLEWVNGFAINDHYPENSVMIGIQPTESAGRAGREGLLSPGQSSQRSSLKQFKPSDRFHNWVCYARRYDELIYPAGVLIVLWCKQTNEQRYYSKHTASVCCVSLGSIEDDMVASGQLAAGDLANRKVGSASLIHIWSLNSLETLRVIEDDQFSGKKILSLRLRNTSSEDCELSVAALDHKRIWAFVFRMNLSNLKRTDDKVVGDKVVATTGQSVIVMRASKVLQAGQTPLLLLKVSDQKERIPVPVDSDRQQPLKDLLLTFGRRHFQVWFANRKQSKLNLLPIDKKRSDFVELIAKANCIAQMSPVEYLVGDAAGSITLLMVNSMIKPSSKSNSTSSTSRLTSIEDRYSVETVPLFVASDDLETNNSQNKRANSITCLTRISGNIFASADSTCTVKFWHIDRRSNQKLAEDSDLGGSSTSNTTKCRLVSSISLPRDLGFICAIIKSIYNRKQSTVEFYAISTSNAILFGSIQLQTSASVHDSSSSANSSISVLYEGHETFAINLVPDCAPPSNPNNPKQTTTTTSNCYFTCSLDYKICKWNGKSLVWKSMLPSACASMAIHPIGFVLAVGSADGTVYILDKFSGLLISYFPLTPVCINCLAYSRDGLLLAAGCANGSIFILPVYERGLKYKKVSIFQSPYPVVSLQFSNDSRYLLTSVTNGPYQELILWDLPHFRYMRDYVKLTADKISWFDPICSGSEDVRAIWENANLANEDEDDSGNLLEPVVMAAAAPAKGKTKPMIKRQSLNASSNMADPAGKVVNLSCHRLIRSGRMMTTTTSSASKPQQQINTEDLVIASDTRGCLRLFRYPCYDIQQGFYEFRLSLSPVNCCRFLSGSCQSEATSQVEFVSTSLDGSICLWSIN